MKNTNVFGFLERSLNTHKIKISVYSIFFLATLLVGSCSKDSIDDGKESIIEGTKITNFSFLKTNNSSLEYDVYLNIEDNTIFGIIPHGVDIENLKATFEHNGLEAVINNVKQISDATINE